MRYVCVAVLLGLACTASEHAPAPASSSPAASTSALPAAPPATSPTAASRSNPARAAADGEWPAIDLRACGITLRHPPSYFTPTNRIGKIVLREVDLLEDTPELRALLAGRGSPSERPPMINFSSYAVPDAQLDPVQWLRARKGPKVAASAIQRVTVAGLPALFYRASDGEAAVDGVVWSCPGRVVEARASFYGRDDRLRQELSRILTMLTVRGSLVESAVRCSPPGLPCSSPQLSLCVSGQWQCVAPGAKAERSTRAVRVR